MNDATDLMLRRPLRQELGAQYNMVLSRLIDVVAEASQMLDNSSVPAEHRIRSAGELLRSYPAKMLTAGSAVPPAPRAVSRGALLAWQVKRVTEYVERHLNETITVVDLSMMVKLSRSHFCRAFRARLNVSPHGFIVQRRVDRSQQLMRSTNAPLASIAADCGFSDQAHFSRVYRKVVGITPGIWRRIQSSMPTLP
jgi:AraC family transcriptional regulator